MEKIHQLWYRRSLDFVDELGLLKRPEKYVSLPLARYLLSSYVALPVEHIIIGERPYATDIHPYVSSAMSYDASKCPGGTPSTNALAADIGNKHDIERETVEEWFASSWKYLHKGVLLLNVCCYSKFMEQSLHERTLTEEFIRDMIYVSLTLSNTQVHIYALGNPARHSASKIRSGVPGSRNRVHSHACQNPASLSHKGSDLRSPDVTLNAPGVSRLLFKLIQKTHGKDVLDNNRYRRMSSGPGSDHGKLVSRTNAMADDFAKVEEYFKSGGKVKSLESAEEIFGNAKESARKFVEALNSARVALVFASIEEPGSVAKGAFKSSNRSYTPKDYKTGTSSRLSSNQSTPARKGKSEPVGFEDDDDTPSGMSTPVVVEKRDTTPTPSTPVRERPPPTVASSRRSASSKQIGFIDEELEPLPTPVVAQDTNPKARSSSVSSNDVITVAELSGISYVCDFMDSNSEYDFPDVIKQEVHECARNKRAASTTAKGLVEAIRVAERNNQRDAEEALGYKDSIIDVPNPIMQWLISQAN